MVLEKIQLDLLAKVIPADKIKEIIQNQNKVINDEQIIRELRESVDVFRSRANDSEREIARLRPHEKTSEILLNKLRVDFAESKNPWKRKYIQELLGIGYGPE